MKYIPLVLPILLGLIGCDEAPQTPPNGARGKPPVLVETAPVEHRKIERPLVRNGTLQALRTAQLSLQQEGVLLELPYHEGESVSRGTLLARLDDTLLRAQLKKSQAQRRQAELDLKRLQKLQHSRVVAEDELARAATALDVAQADEEELQIRLQQTRLTAPFDGIISARLAEPGDTLARLSHLLSLIDTSKLTTVLHLSELEIAGLQLGDPVSLTIDALGPQPQPGTILRIHPGVDEASRQGTIEVLLQAPPSGAMPGQLCRVTLTLGGHQRILVPYNALRRDNRGEYLFVVTTQEKVERRGVVSGLHFNEMVEMLQGVQPGERIVTRGFLGLAEGSSVAATTKGSRETP